MYSAGVVCRDWEDSQNTLGIANPATYCRFICICLEMLEIAEYDPQISFLRQSAVHGAFGEL